MRELRPAGYPEPTGPERRSTAGRSRAAAVAGSLAAMLAVTLVPFVAMSAGQHVDPAQLRAAAAGEPCTRILEGTEWVFDPCIPEGDPLPPDVIEDLEEVRRERCASPTPTSTPVDPTELPTDQPSETATAAGVPGQRAMATTVPSYTVAPTATLDPTGSPSPTGPPDPTPTVDPTPTDTGSPTASPSECPSPTGTASPSPTDTGTPSPTPTGTGSPTPTPTETGTPTPTPTTPSPTPTSGCPPIVGPGAPANELEEAGKDRIECRDPQRIPDPQNPVVLVATGDSVTSAHHQFGFGALCANTSFDNRLLTGNNAVFSYVGRYFTNLNPNAVEYYNLARTGFNTTEMRGAVAGTTDTCGNPWGRAFPPVQLADSVIRKAKAAGHKAYYVTTGGINNTNWTDVLEALITCRALELANNGIPRFPGSQFSWNAIGGRAGIVTNGGGCTLRVFNPNPFGMDLFHRVGVPRYDGPNQYAGITADVTAIVNAILAAGADKIVWMLYYDILAGNIDIANFMWAYMRAAAPAWVLGYLPPLTGPVLQPVIDPMWVGAVRALSAAVNAAIVAGIPANPKVVAQPAPIFAAADIQVTAKGGSPHPSVAGHTKLSNTLNAGFNLIP